MLKIHIFCVAIWSATNAAHLNRMQPSTQQITVNQPFDRIPTGPQQMKRISPIPMHLTPIRNPLMPIQALHQPYSRMTGLHQPISRMATIGQPFQPVNGMKMRAPTAFRPGASLQRPWVQKVVPSPQRSQQPYVVYRNSPQRFAVRHFHPQTSRNVITPWKTTRVSNLPPNSIMNSEMEFVKAASAPPHIKTDGGAIHTIPAPNLSLSEKPIVVIESEGLKAGSASSDVPKPTYEVTENPATFQITAKIEPSIGFSKATALTNPEIQALIRTNAALQLASEYGYPAIALPQSPPLFPQQFSIPNLGGLSAHNDLLHQGHDSLLLQPNALYHPDPLFMQKLQNQLMQRFPGLEIIPYASNIHQTQVPLQTSQPQMMFYNEQIKQSPSSFVTNDPQKNLFQRDTPESAVITLIAGTESSNGPENQIEVTSASQPQNVTFEFVTETQPAATTVKYLMDSTTEEQKTSPIYFAQVGQSLGSGVAKGFYSAINDVRAAAAAATDSIAASSTSTAQVEKLQEENFKEKETVEENNTTTSTSTENPDLKSFFQHKEKEDNNTIGDLKPILGIPFGKSSDSVNVTYTLVRSGDKETKIIKDGVIYAGQLVESAVSEDKDFNKEKTTLIAKRAPLRLVAVKDKGAASNSSGSHQKFTVVKAKIPPKSKLTFDDKTGEPVLRIYASYVDSPLQKDIIVSRLTKKKPVKEATRKQDSADSWNPTSIKEVENFYGVNNFDNVSDFGLKLRSRSDDYTPIFQDYED